MAQFSPEEISNLTEWMTQILMGKSSPPYATIKVNLDPMILYDIRFRFLVKDLIAKYPDNAEMIQHNARTIGLIVVSGHLISFSLLGIK